VARDLDLLLTSKDCFLKSQVQVIAQVGATPRTAPSGCAKSKPPSKDLLKNLKGISEAKVIPESGPTRHGMSETIVRGSFLGVGEHLVGFIQFLEAYLGVGRIADVRMPLAGQLPICFFDLILGRRTIDSQDFVVIAPR
jgi:hypothetical protein